MKKLINYEILMSIITLGVFFVIFWLTNRCDADVATYTAVSVAGTVATAIAFTAIIVAPGAPAVVTAGVVATAFTAAAAAFTAAFTAGITTGGVAGGGAVIAIAITVGVGGNYARRNNIAKKKVFASLAVEFIVIMVPLLLLIF